MCYLSSGALVNACEMLVVLNNLSELEHESAYTKRSFSGLTNYDPDSDELPQNTNS